MATESNGNTSTVNIDITEMSKSKDGQYVIMESKLIFWEFVCINFRISVTEAEKKEADYQALKVKDDKRKATNKKSSAT